MLKWFHLSQICSRVETAAETIEEKIREKKLKLVVSWFKNGGKGMSDIENVSFSLLHGEPVQPNANLFHWKCLTFQQEAAILKKVVKK